MHESARGVWPGIGGRHRLLVPLLATLALLGLAIGAVVAATSYAHEAAGVTKTISSPLGFVRATSSTPPAFRLPELDHPTVDRSLSSLEGRPLVLDFWSSTCTVCAQEAPALERAYRELGGRVEFVGIDTAQPSRGDGIAFASEHHLSYTMLYDGSAAVASRYDVPGLPVTFFVSAAGKLLGENLGAITSPELVRLLGRLDPSLSREGRSP